MDNYVGHFIKYATNTNGKKILSTKLKEYLSNYFGGTLLDVGAGDGQITANLASVFSEVIAVEPRTELASMISNKNNVSIIQDKIENYNTHRKYDVILMSYFLDSFTAEEIRCILRKLYLLKATSGIMIGATYSSNCKWDRFAERVSSDLGFHRKGGYNRVSSRVTAYGEFNCRVVDEVETNISGDTIQNLYDNLIFFFKSNVDGYSEKRNIYMRWLEDYCTYEEGKYQIEVIENIFEINLNKM